MIKFKLQTYMLSHIICLWTMGIPRKRDTDLPDNRKQ